MNSTQRPSQLVMLDWDGTLGIVKSVMERFYTVGERYGLNKKEFEDAKAEVAANFSPVALARKKLGDKFEAFKEEFIADDATEVMYDDAKRLLARLDEANVPHMVLTYGVSREWQEMKRAAGGYVGPRIVIDRQDKGKVIAGWQFGSDYMVRGEDRDLYVSAVVLVDDRVRSLKNLPATATGYIIQRPHESDVRSQQEGLPLHAVAIQSLDELIIKDHKLTLK